MKSAAAVAQATIQRLEAENRLLREQLAAMRGEMERLGAVVAELRQENAALREENAALASRVAELESQVKANSRNSSRPPSSDGPQTNNPKRRVRGGKRSRGGQKGHQGHSRARAKREEADEEEAVVPTACEKCGASLADEPNIGEPKGQPNGHKLRSRGGCQGGERGRIAERSGDRVRCGAWERKDARPAACGIRARSSTPEASRSRMHRRQSRWRSGWMS